MVNVYALSETQILLFALILLRMVAFVVSAAIFSMPMINAHTKVLLAVLLAMIVQPTVKFDPAIVGGLSNDIISLAARELLVGLTLGFLTRLFFFTVSMTGDMASTALGLNSAQMFNPMVGAQGGVIEQMYNLLGIMFFLIINGHHMMISALVQSFETIHVGALSINYAVYSELANLGQSLLLITIKMSAPIMVTILVTNLAMGILGRAIPQLNVLVTSIPVTIMIGLLVMFVTIPLFILEMNGLVDLTATKLLSVLKAL